jgi:hypothetical protein
MTVSVLHLIPPISCRMCCCGSYHHSRWNAGSNWRKFCTGSTACTRQPSMSQTCSIGFKSGSWLTMEEKSRLHFEGRWLLPLERYSLALSSINIGLAASRWWIGEQQLFVRHLRCTDHLLGFLVWWPSATCNHERYTPISLLSLHRKTVGWMFLEV